MWATAAAHVVVVVLDQPLDACFVHSVRTLLELVRPLAAVPGLVLASRELVPGAALLVRMRGASLVS